jgi:hypothetical protein
MTEEPAAGDVNAHLHYTDDQGRRRWPHIYEGGYHKVPTGSDPRTRIEIKIVAGEPLGPLVEAGFWVRMSGSDGVRAGLIAPQTLRAHGTRAPSAPDAD